MIKRQLRWGILGCANIAIRALIPAIRASQTGTLLAIASRDRGKVNEVAAQHAIPRAYASYESLLADPEVDAVYIPLPNHLHREWTIRAAAAGKHILCEKPLALNAAEAEEMVEACARHSVQLAEAFMYRYHPRYDRVRAVIAAGEIGAVRSLHGSFRFNISGRPGNVRLVNAYGGGSIYDVGCYPISAARLLLGQEPEAVTVHAHFAPEFDGVDMNACGLVEFPGGVSLGFDSSLWSDRHEHLEIVGSEGRILLSPAFIAHTAEAAAFTVISRGEQRVEQPAHRNSYTEQVDALGRTVLDGEPPRFSAADAVANMRVLDACYRSARTRARVSVAG